MAKSEEDRLKQEVMRLEIRRTELEMLKEAVRAGIQPQLIPQIFGGGSNHSGNPSIYTPISPSQASGPASRTPYPPPPQQIPPFSKQGQPSPRYLPKLDTANLPTSHGQQQQQQPATANPTINEQRHMTNHFNNEAPQSAPSIGGNMDSEPSSLSFHHWRPPQLHPGQNQGTNESPQGPRALSLSDNPGSPTPRKKKAQQQQQHQGLPPAASPSAAASRRSPSRGHARHRSEASGLAHRFNGQYAPPAVSNNGIFSAKMSNDRASPNLGMPPLSSHEMDTARKRKREQEGEASVPVTEGSIREEPAVKDS